MPDPSDITLPANEIKQLESLLRTSGDGGRYGLTDAGFVPKPYLQLLREGFAAARAVLGEDIDLAKGSVVRKLIEMSAIENARTYAMMAGIVDDMTVPTARGVGLSRLGRELGLARPFMRAGGSVKLTLIRDIDTLSLGRGARLTNDRGDPVFLTNAVALSKSAPTAQVAVEAFYPGIAGNLDPLIADQKLRLWSSDGPENTIEQLALAALSLDKPMEEIVAVEHATPLSGGEARWPDEPYRDLLLRMPRSVWTPDAIRHAVSMVPGVRRVTIIDQFGGLDIGRAIYGNFNFIERLFSAERDITSPYGFTILVAIEDGAVWNGTGGVHQAIRDAVEYLRPIGLFPQIEPEMPPHVCFRATIVVQGLPLPGGSKDSMNHSAPARALKERLLLRVRSYIDGLDYGEPVRSAKVNWQLLSDPNVLDVQNLELGTGGGVWLASGQNVVPQGRSIPVLVESESHITLI